MQAKHAYRNSHILLPPDNVCMSIICSHFPPEPIVRCNAPAPRLFPTGQSCNHSRITLAIGAIKCHPREKGTRGRSERQHQPMVTLPITCHLPVNPCLGDGGQFLLIRNNWIQTKVFDERQIRVTFHIWEIRRDVSRSLCLWTGTLRGTRKGPCVEQVWGWEGGLPRVWGEEGKYKPPHETPMSNYSWDNQNEVSAQQTSATETAETYTKERG